MQSGYSHSGDVFTREGIGGVANQQTGLTHSPEEEGQQRTHEYKYIIQHVEKLALALYRLCARVCVHEYTVCVSEKAGCYYLLLCHTDTGLHSFCLRDTVASL